MVEISPDPDSVESNESSSSEDLSWLESLSYEEYEDLLKKQESSSKDAKDFGPYWLEKVQGSLAEERRKPSPNKDLAYNKQVSKARRTSRQDPLSLKDFLVQPEKLNIKLSLLWSLYPSLQIFVDLDVQKITKRSSRHLRSFMIYFYHHNQDFPSWVKWLIEENFDKILRGEDCSCISPRILMELKAIRYIFLVLGSTEGFLQLTQIYSKKNLDHWEEVAEELISSYTNLINIPVRRVRQKVWKRGYKESHSNKHKSKDQRGEVAMSTEGRSIEEIKQSILKKQAILFERRLDEFLQLSNEELSQTEKKEIFRNLLEEGIPREPDEEEINNQIWKS